MGRTIPAVYQPNSVLTPIFWTETEEPERNINIVAKQPHQSTPRGHKWTFPSRLHHMLSDVDAKGLTDIVEWQPHGRAFIIIEPRELHTNILPLYFKSIKWSSFQRQLNIYGFSRLTCGVDRGCYYHPKFLRGRPELCEGIIRQDVKGMRERIPHDPRNEPNFHAGSSFEEASSDSAGPITHDPLRLSPSMPTSIPVSPMGQMSNVAMVLQRAMTGSAGGQEAHAANKYEVHTNENGFIPTRNYEVPAGITPPKAVSEGLDHLTQMKAVSSVTKRSITRPVDTAEEAHNFSNDSCVDSDEGPSSSWDTIADDTITDDILKIVVDPVDLHEAFASTNTPCSVDDLDELPRGEMEWGHYVEKICCGDYSDDLLKIPGDLVYRDEFALLNEPFCMDVLDKLPKDEI